MVFMNITTFPAHPWNKTAIATGLLAIGSVACSAILIKKAINTFFQEQTPNHSLHALRSPHPKAVMKQLLEAWEKEASITASEKANRAIAAKNIQKCYDQREASLDLFNLGLTSRPDLSYLSSLTILILHGNQLTSFSGQGLSSLTDLCLEGNQLISFSGQGLSSLTHLYLQGNRLPSFSGQGLSSLKTLFLQGNQLTSFDGQGLSSLTDLRLQRNQLTSFRGQGLSSLRDLYLEENQLTVFDGQGLSSSLTRLYLNGNQLRSFSDITLPSPNTLQSVRLARNPFRPVARGPQIITMRIPTGVIQDIPEDSLPQYGVEILSRSSMTSGITLAGILTKLCGQNAPTQYKDLLKHEKASELATFLRRMMWSWPRYDGVLKSFVNLAERNQRFREELFDGVVSTETNCHDRPLYFFSKLSVTAAAYQAEQEGNPQALVQSLFALKYLDYIDEAAQTACPKEALEIALYLQLQLRDSLPLPIAIQSMAFDQFAEIAISNYLASNPQLPEKTVAEWVNSVAESALSASITDQQKKEILCDTPYFAKQCQNDPQYRQIQLMYGAAANIILETTDVNKITTLADVVTEEEISLLENTTLKDLQLLAASALPTGISLTNLTEQQKKDAYEQLNTLKNEALRKTIAALMDDKARDLINRSH
jgi:Leucine-rich repeat (LRR) protein